MPMPSRDHLQQLLNELEDTIPVLQRAYPDGSDFWPEFAPLADAIRSVGGPENDEWIWDRIDAMLRFHGLSTRPLPA